jgi:hypothetical protein
MVNVVICLNIEIDERYPHNWWPRRDRDVPITIDSPCMHRKPLWVLASSWWDGNPWPWDQRGYQQAVSLIRMFDDRRSCGRFQHRKSLMQKSYVHTDWPWTDTNKKMTKDRPDLSSERVNRAWLQWRGPAATVNYRPVHSSERALQNYKPATAKFKEKEKLVPGPGWGPDTKTDWPPDCRW